MLTFEIANQLGRQWVDTWNNKSIDDYLNLYTDDVQVVSSLALRLFPESNGTLQDKKLLKNYWELLKTRYPNYIFQMDVVRYFDDKLIVYYSSLDQSVRAIAVLTIREDLLIRRVEVSYV
mgnify:CR=1 FL=1|jgi:hypothetical protein